MENHTVKIAMLAALALLAGSLLGGWPQATQIYRLQDQVAALELRLEQRAFDGNPSLSGISRMLNVPDSVPPPEPPAEPDPDAGIDLDEEAEIDADDADADRVAEAPPEPPPEPSPRPPNRDEMRRRIDEAARLWQMRSELARDGFLQAVGADDEQVLRFDVLMEAMNMRLAHSMENWAQVLAEEEMPVREVGVRMMKEISEALVITYDEMDRGMPPGWRQDAGPEFQLIDHINPEVALPLAEVGDRLEF